MLNNIYLRLSFLIEIFYFCNRVIEIGANPHYDGQPNTVAIYYNYQWMAADRSRHYMNSAGLPGGQIVDDILLNATKNLDGYEEDPLGFDSYDYLRKCQSIRWQLDSISRTSIHVYDRPNDIKLAAGPNVDQPLCGLHLNYMLHMTEKHHQHFTNSTDWSIFNMIHSFGSPTLQVASGNTNFLGDFEACKMFKLSINREDLNKVDSSQTEQYFKKSIQLSSGSQLSSIWKYIKTTLGPFIGFVEVIFDSYEPMEKYQDKIRLQSTVYCVAGIRWASWPNTTYHKRNVVLRIGVCLPDTCDSSSLELHGEKIKRLMDIQMPDYYKDYYINDLYCLPDEKSPLRNPLNYTKTVLFLAFNMIWIALTIGATITVYLKRKIKDRVEVNGGASKHMGDPEEASWYMYLKCWCLASNSSNLISASGEKKIIIHCQDSDHNRQSKRNKVDLSPLDGLKVVGFIAIVIVHSLLAIPITARNMIPFLYSSVNSVAVAISPLTQASVDLFFVITGVITSIKLLQESRKTLVDPLFWLQFFVYRYIRVVPTYLFVHWAIQSYARFLGSGPHWDYGTSENSLGNICENDSLWGVVFLTANMKSPIAHCNPVGWYFANDLQIMLITPLLIILYLNRPTIGHLVGLVGTLAVMFFHFQYYNNLLPETEGYLNFLLLPTYVLKDGALGYVMPQYRCLSYLIGLSTGCLLLQYGRGEIKSWPKWFVTSGKIFIYAILYVMSFVLYLKSLLPSDNQPLVHLMGALFGGTLHWFASAAIAVFIVLLCTGHFPKAATLLGHGSLKIPSAASLSLVLIHCPLIIYKSLVGVFPQDISIYIVFTTTLTVIMESLILGLIFHVVYELPMRRFLIKYLINLFGGNNEKLRHNCQNPSTEMAQLNQSKLKSA